MQKVEAEKKGTGFEDFMKNPVCNSSNALGTSKYMDFHSFQNVHRHFIKFKKMLKCDGKSSQGYIKNSLSNLSGPQKLCSSACLSLSAPKIPVKKKKNACKSFLNYSLFEVKRSLLKGNMNRDALSSSLYCNKNKTLTETFSNSLLQSNHLKNTKSEYGQQSQDVPLCYKNNDNTHDTTCSTDERDVTKQKALPRRQKIKQIPPKRMRKKIMLPLEVTKIIPREGTISDFVIDKSGFKFGDAEMKHLCSSIDEQLSIKSGFKDTTCLKNSSYLKPSAKNHLKCAEDLKKTGQFCRQLKQTHTILSSKNAQYRPLVPKKTVTDLELFGYSARITENQNVDVTKLQILKNHMQKCLLEKQRDFIEITDAIKNFNSSVSLMLNEHQRKKTNLSPNSFNINNENGINFPNRVIQDPNKMKKVPIDYSCDVEENWECVLDESGINNKNIHKDVYGTVSNPKFEVEPVYKTFDEKTGIEISLVSYNIDKSKSEMNILDANAEYISNLSAAFEELLIFSEFPDLKQYNVDVACDGFENLINICFEDSTCAGKPFVKDNSKAKRTKTLTNALFYPNENFVKYLQTMPQGFQTGYTDQNIVNDKSHAENIDVNNSCEQENSSVIKCDENDNLCKLSAVANLYAAKLNSSESYLLQCTERNTDPINNSLIETNSTYSFINKPSTKFIENIGLKSYAEDFEISDITPKSKTNDVSKHFDNKPPLLSVNECKTNLILSDIYESEVDSLVTVDSDMTNLKRGTDKIEIRDFDTEPKLLKENLNTNLTVSYNEETTEKSVHDTKSFEFHDVYNQLEEDCIWKTSELWDKYFIGNQKNATYVNISPFLSSEEKEEQARKVVERTDIHDVERKVLNKVSEGTCLFQKQTKSVVSCSKKPRSSPIKSLQKSEILNSTEESRLSFNSSINSLHNICMNTEVPDRKIKAFCKWNNEMQSEVSAFSDRNEVSLPNSIDLFSGVSSTSNFSDSLLKDTVDLNELGSSGQEGIRFLNASEIISSERNDSSQCCDPAFQLWHTARDSNKHRVSLCSSYSPDSAFESSVEQIPPTSRAVSAELLATGCVLGSKNTMPVKNTLGSTGNETTEIKMPSLVYARSSSHDENTDSSEKYSLRQPNILPWRATGYSVNKPFLVNLCIEGKDIHCGPFPFEVLPSMTLRMLKIKVENEFGVRTSAQKWILGRNIANDNDVTLSHHDVMPGSHVFLYLMDPVMEKNDQLKTLRNRNTFRVNEEENLYRKKQYEPKPNGTKYPRNHNNNKDFEKCYVDNQLCSLEYDRKSFSRLDSCEVNQPRELKFGKSKTQLERIHYMSSTGESEPTKQLNVTDTTKDRQSLKTNYSIKKQANFQKILSPLLQKKGILETKVYKHMTETKDNLKQIFLHKEASEIKQEEKFERNSKLLSLNMDYRKSVLSENLRSPSMCPSSSNAKDCILNNIDNGTKTLSFPSVYQRHQTTESGNTIENNNCFSTNMLSDLSRDYASLYSTKTPIYSKTIPPHCGFLEETEEITEQENGIQQEVKSIPNLNSKAFQSNSFVDKSLECPSASSDGQNTNIENISSNKREYDQKIPDDPQGLSTIHTKYGLKGGCCTIENTDSDRIDDSVEIQRECESKEDTTLMIENKDWQNYELLLALDNQDLIVNSESFECPVCFSAVQEMSGVVLRDCLHTFCRECLSSAIVYGEEALVKCPFRNDLYSCDSYLQQREIKSLVSTDLYEQYLQKSIIAAECHAEKSFHCKSPDCLGWCLYEDNVNIFHCPICYHYNCLTCQAIHEGLNCCQYQDQLKQNAKLDKDAEKTLEFLDKMVEEGQAMKCPKCCVVLMKKWGCDWLKCSVCQTEICWITKGPRWGPEGRGDTSSGCKCGVNGIRCHPSCTYCH